MRCWWLPKKIIPSSSFISLFFQPKMIAVTRWFSRRDRPWSPNVGGHLSNLWKCHIITIPKRPLRSRKIARCTVQCFSGYFLLALFNHQRMLWVGFLDGFKRKLLHGLTLWHPLFLLHQVREKSNSIPGLLLLMAEIRLTTCYLLNPFLKKWHSPYQLL